MRWIIIIFLIFIANISLAQYSSITIDSTCEIFNSYKWRTNASFLSVNTNSCNTNEFYITNDINYHANFLHTKDTIIFNNDCLEFMGEFEYNYDGRADGITFFFASAGFNNPGTGLNLGLDPSLKGLVLNIDLYKNSGSWDTTVNHKLITLAYLDGFNGYQELNTRNIIGNPIITPLLPNRYYKFKLHYQNGLTHVYLDNNLIIAGSVALNNTFGTFGFTGSTGGFASIQKVKNVRIDFQANSLTKVAYDTICEADAFTYLFKNRPLPNTAPGNYVFLDTFTSVLGGCDSIVTLNLHIKTSPTSNLTDTICSRNLPYIIGDSILTQGGSYRIVMLSNTDCDSILHLNLVVLDDPIIHTTLFTGCDSVFYNNAWYKNSFMISDTIFNSFGCDSVIYQNKVVINHPDFDTITKMICPGDSFVFDGKIYTQSGIYAHRFTNQNGCDSLVKLNLLISLRPNIQINHLANPHFCDGDTIFLQATGAEVYIWEGYLFDINNDIAKAVVFAPIENKFIVKGRNSYGCEHTTTVTYTANYCCDYYTPNAFTPNDDGLNDVYKILVPGMPKKYKLLIFNRYGQIVFESVKPNEGWDGYINGKAAELGVYYYLLETQCGSDVNESIIQKGELTLIR